MKPQFKISSTERMYVTEKYYTNGHWAVLRECVDKNLIKELKDFRKLFLLPIGCYSRGIGTLTPDNQNLPNVDHVIPNMSLGEHRKLDVVNPVRVIWGNELEVNTIVFKSIPLIGETSFEIGIDPKYVNLLHLGEAFAKSTGPIVVTNNDKVMAVVMPKRI